MTDDAPTGDGTAEDRRAPLTRVRIVETAVAMADAGGLAGLSMRKVAAELGFEVMSLYNHIANKNDLLAAMVEHAASEIGFPDLADGWKPALRANAIATKEMFERHPWATNLWISTLPGPHRFDQMEWQLRTLDASGLDPRRAHDAFHAIGNHVVGYMMANQAMNVSVQERGEAEMIDEVMSSLDDERHAHVIAHIHQHLDGDHGPSFEFVLDLLIDGIAPE